jgi:hypothetical protein
MKNDLFIKNPDENQNTAALGQEFLTKKPAITSVLQLIFKFSVLKFFENSPSECNPLKPIVVKLLES